MPPRRQRRWKQVLQWLLPVLFVECPSGTDHWFYEQWCLCEYQDHSSSTNGPPGESVSSGADGAHGPGDPHDGVFDLKRWEKARQGPEGYRPGNTAVQIGDYVQPEGLELRPPLAWKVVAFEARGDNPKYLVILEYPLSGDRVTLENLPRNTRQPGAANDPTRVGRLSEVCDRRPAAR